MEFKFLRKHYQNLVHEYEIDTKSLIPFGILEGIKKVYLENIDEAKKNKNAANVELTRFDEFREYSLEADKVLKKLIEKFYVTENNYGVGGLNVYYSKKDIGVYDFHDHYDSDNMATIGAVFYWHNMEKGNSGEISFKRPHLPEYKIFPKFNRLYTFPYWLAHKPNPYNGEGERFCFNWCYVCSNRPVHKLTGDVW